MRKLLLLAVIIMVSFTSANASAEDSAGKFVIVDSSQQIADKIIKSKIPVLVDFWAAWCMPCRMLNPIIKELEEEYNGKVMFLKVNIDVHRAISSYFGVRAIPAVFIIKDKTVVKVLPGLNPKEAYDAALKEVAMVSEPKNAPLTDPATQPQQ
jgi:thioredoxin 1